ncbi:MAG: hypothetical protein Kow00108_20900 [Calditrichia bacterium]
MNNIYYCRLKTVTPVFIGSGNYYNNNLDYKFENNAYYFFDLGYVFSKLEEQNDIQMIQKLSDEVIQKKFSLENFCKEAAIDFDRVVYKKVHLRKFTNKIGKFYRNGLAIPFVPGSSLKGAIRTALLKYFIDQESKNDITKFLPNDDVKKQDLDLLKHIFGPDSNANIMRCIQVSDAKFASEDLKIIDSRIFNLLAEGYGYLQLNFKENKQKKGKGKKKTHSPTQWYLGTPNIMEMLKENAKSTLFTISLDTYLESHWKELFGNNQRKLPSNLLSVLKKYAIEKIQEEKIFFKRHGHHKAAEFYNMLENMQKNTSDNQTLIRVGWGGGWNFMTGNFLDDQSKNHLRRMFNLGKKGHPVFPKSRKLITDGDNEPYIPPGWLMLELITKEEALIVRQQDETKINTSQPNVEKPKRHSESNSNTSTKIQFNKPSDLIEKLDAISSLNDVKFFLMLGEKQLKADQVLNELFLNKLKKLKNDYDDRSKERKEIEKMLKQYGEK